MESPKHFLCRQCKQRMSKSENTIEEIHSNLLFPCTQIRDTWVCQLHTLPVTWQCWDDQSQPWGWLLSQSPFACLRSPHPWASWQQPWWTRLPCTGQGLLPKKEKCSWSHNLWIDDETMKCRVSWNNERHSERSHNTLMQKLYSQDVFCSKSAQREVWLWLQIVSSHANNDCRRDRETFTEIILMEIFLPGRLCQRLPVQYLECKWCHSWDIRELRALDSVWCQCSDKLCLMVILTNQSRGH